MRMRKGNEDVIKSICPFCHTEWDPNWLQVEKSHDEVLEKVTILGLVRTTTHYAMTGILFYTVINFGYAYAPPVIGCWYIAKLLMDKYFPV